MGTLRTRCVGRATSAANVFVPEYAATPAAIAPPGLEHDTHGIDLRASMVGERAYTPLRERTFTMRSTSHVMATLCSVLFLACDFGVTGSGGGGTVRAVPSPSAPENINVVYANWLDFSSDLTQAVDSLLADVRAGDKDSIRLLREYLEPALDVLGRHGFAMPALAIEALPAAREARFTTAWSPWQSSGTRCGGLSSADACEWRARIVSSSVYFNPITPRRLYFRAGLEIKTRTRLNGTRYVSAPLDPQRAKALTDTLKEDLRSRYVAHLARLGASTTRRGFGGAR